MKKQIFIFVFFALAVFAGVNKSYGQKATHGNTAPTAITCTPDALNPIAGVPYSYQADITPAGGTAIWHAVYNQTNLFATNAWAATDEVVGTGSFISAATGYGTNAAATSPSKTTITWKSEGLATVDATHPLLVALEYTAPASGCANNLQVFEITPKNAFTLDITAMDNTGATSQPIGTSYAQCFSVIASAVYNSGTPGTVKMDYGDNTTYFEVIAANFTTSWNTSFKLDGLQGDQTADVTWGYSVATAGANNIATDTPNATLGPITAETDATDTSNGVSIFVKVVVHNKAWEGIANESITLAVEGTNVAGESDVLTDCTVPAAASQFEDIATQTLNARPTVDNPTPTPFLNKN